MAKKSIRMLACLLLSLLLFSSLLAPVTEATRVPARRVSAEQSVYLGGMPFGVKFMTEGVLVVGYCDVGSGGSARNPSREAGLRPGDVILRVGGRPLIDASALSSLVENGRGSPLALSYARDGKEYEATLTPVYSESEGRYKSGLCVRDSGAGIGTVTYIQPDTLAFGGLGHGICDAETGELLPIGRGSVVSVTIHDVVRGLAGSPGQVKGHFSSGKIGTLLGNSACGVFGVLSKLPEGAQPRRIPLGKRSELTCGKAYLYCTLDGNGTQRYEVEISDIHADATSNKCFTVHVTDARLLEKSGGVVQGMSGSPLEQNGKLVGAVTHVLVGDPTTGYGIFIENMLNQMGDLAG